MRVRPKVVKRAIAATAAATAELDPPEQSSLFMNLFPLWVLLGCLSGLFFPQLYVSWYKPIYVTSMLAVTMLCMGFTLSIEDMMQVLKSPHRVGIGALLQYSIMPALGFLLSKLPSMPTPFAAGIILVACCPGGTASNIIAYLARADVGLSVMMTTASTLAAVIMTPLLTTTLIGTVVPVDGMALFVSTLQVVLAPVLTGITLNRFFPRAIARIAPYAPPVAVFMVALTCATVMAQAAGAVQQAGLFLLGAVALLHTGGFALGYGVSKAIGLEETTSRTNSIEVGMQNSTLGASLALMHFGDPLTAAPCAISACLHSMIGSLLAGFWRQRDPYLANAGTQSPPTAATSTAPSVATGSNKRGVDDSSEEKLVASSHIAAHQCSSRHRKEVEASAICGCFFCRATFSPGEIREWCDEGKTAMCPRCRASSVIGDASGYPIDQEFLTRMQRHWI